jgi:putative DNA primase/helicase
VRQYREESDTLGRFLGECCEIRPNAQVKSSSLFKRYQEFADAAGERWVPAKDFPAELQRRGHEWKRTKTGGMFFGIGLSANDETDWADRR